MFVVKWLMYIANVLSRKFNFCMCLFVFMKSAVNTLIWYCTVCCDSMRYFWVEVNLCRFSLFVYTCSYLEIWLIFILRWPGLMVVKLSSATFVLVHVLLKLSNQNKIFVDTVFWSADFFSNTSAKLVLKSCMTLRYKWKWHYNSRTKL
jgi:hypothetical protein